MLEKNSKFIVALFCISLITDFCSAQSLDDSNKKIGLIREVLHDTKFECNSNDVTIYNVSSHLQCVHHCLRQFCCEIVNFKVNSSGEDNCEVYNLPSRLCSNTTLHNNWKATILQRNGSHNGKVYKCCKELHDEKSNLNSGVFELESGLNICMMGSIEGCGAGGWTLAMKLNGSKSTFAGNSNFWSTMGLYNAEDGLKSFSGIEAKFPAFNHVSFTAMCIGMQSTGSTKWLKITLTSTSLLHLFSSAEYHQTNISRQTWKSLIPNSSLQLGCSREGLNVKDENNRLRARIGIIGNNEENCQTPDSFLGLGAPYYGFTTSHNIYSGNFAYWSPDNGIKAVPAFGYILVK